MALSLKPALAIALLVGVGAGGTAAALIPAAESASLDGAFAAPSGALRSAPAGQRERGPKDREGVHLTPERGSVQVLIRREDPAGGAPWLVRGFDARQQRPGIDHVPLRCVQLGREVAGKFGWIDGDHVFRPVSLRSRSGIPNQCRAAREAGGFGAILKLATLLDRPTSATPTVRGSVLWGTAGSEPGPIKLTANGRTRRVQPGRSGGFLEFYGPARSVVGARLREGSPGGRVIASVARDAVPNAPLMPERRRSGLRLGTAQVIARAPDPGGGPSWAVTGVQRRAGGWCTSLLGNLIGTHVGDVAGRLGLLMEAPPDRGWNRCMEGENPTREWPVALTPSGGRYLTVPDKQRGVAEQRLLPGRTILWGRAMPSVESVTIRTPRDVRTLRPSGPARGLIAVYDGTFPMGSSADVTVRFQDGSTRQIQTSLGLIW